MGKMMRPHALVVAALLLTSSTANAQAMSRKEQLRRQRLEKIEDLEEPQPPGGFEKLLNGVQERTEGGGGGSGFMGFSPRLGGLKSGAGVAAGIRFDPFSANSRVLLQADAQASLRRYWGAGVRAGYRLGPVRLLGYARYRHMPQEVFYGIGPESSIDDRTNFRLNETVLGGLAGIHLGGGFSVGVRSSYIRSDPGPGRDEDYPDALDVWSVEDVPELHADARHSAIGGWLEFEGRDPDAPRRFFRFLAPTEDDLIGMPLATDRGLHVLGEIVRFASLNDSPFGFTRASLQGQQYVPFRHGRNVFAFREYLALSNADDEEIPLYMLPALGGAYSLRGYELYRFRDRHALMINAEYRWQIWLYADLALFVDAGQVFHEAEDISLSNLHRSYGAGLRLRASEVGVARMDVARSSEGTQIHLRLGAFF